MKRYKLTIEYDGTHFCGWQKQHNGVSIQEKIESAIRSFSGVSAQIYGAGRTDAGVHALGQVAHVDLETRYSLCRIQQALNHFLRPYIAILSIEEVAETFHARFSAIKKRYAYKIITRSAPLTLALHRAWAVRQTMDITAMKEAARVLMGTHDFTSFRSTACQAKSPIKTLDCVEILAENGCIEIIFEAKSFLHNQVRIMASALKNVATSRMLPKDLERILQAKNRANIIETAPPYGLYLKELYY